MPLPHFAVYTYGAWKVCRQRRLEAIPYVFDADPALARHGSAGLALHLSITQIQLDLNARCIGCLAGGEEFHATRLRRSSLYLPGRAHVLCITSTVSNSWLLRPYSRYHMIFCSSWPTICTTSKTLRAAYAQRVNGCATTLVGESESHSTPGSSSVEHLFPSIASFPRDRHSP